MGNVRWHGPSSHPTFSWTEAGVEHRCSMNKTLRARVHLKVELPLDKNFTSELLNREDNSGIFWGNTGKTNPFRTACYIVQSIGLLKLCGLRENDECRLCKRLHLDVTPWLESLNRIQARCPVLQTPGVSRHLARATYSHQQELRRDTRRRREEMVFRISCQRGHSR